MFTTKNTALLAPYGSAQFMSLATKIGGGKSTITQASNGEGKGFGISTAADPGKVPPSAS